MRRTAKINGIRLIPSQQVCLHMHDPREPHLTAMKCILRYLQGTLDLGLLIRHTSTLDLVVSVMLTEPVVPTLVGPLQAKRCSWMTTLSPDP
jgi:hypothetical protein